MEANTFPAANNKSNERHNSATFSAALITGLFTLIGVLSGVVLDRFLTESFARELQRQQLASTIAQRAQGRWFRAHNVMQAVGSSKFESRWDDYILNGVTAWNQDILLMEDGMERYFPDAKPSFDRLKISFRDLNSALITYHQNGGRPPEADRKRTGEIRDRVGDEVGQLVNQLFESL
jgi:hypothetical protein